MPSGAAKFGVGIWNDLFALPLFTVPKSVDRLIPYSPSRWLRFKRLSRKGSESNHGCSFPTKWQTYPDFWHCPRLHAIESEVNDCDCQSKARTLVSFQALQMWFQEGKTFMNKKKKKEKHFNSIVGDKSQILIMGDICVLEFTVHKFRQKSSN